MDLKKLTEPFPEKDVEWRVGQSGKTAKGYWAKVLAYVTARAVQERLDEVFGPMGWQVNYIRHEGGWLCNLECYDPEKKQWVHKSDGAEDTQIESFKGGLSGALKRAAVQWGIGRYLYRLEEEWAETSEQKQNGWHYAKTTYGEAFYWRPPALPLWALPGNAAVSHTPKAVPLPAKSEPEPSDGLNPVERARIETLGIKKGNSTPKQRNMIWALLGKLGISKDHFAAMLKYKFGIDSSTSLSKEQASQVIEGLKDKLEKEEKESEEVLKAIDEQGKAMDKQMQEFSFDTTSAFHHDGVSKHSEELWPEETQQRNKRQTANALRVEASGLISALKVKTIDISGVFKAEGEVKKELESWSKEDLIKLVDDLNELNKQPIESDKRS